MAPGPDLTLVVPADRLPTSASHPYPQFPPTSFFHTKLTIQSPIKLGGRVRFVEPLGPPPSLEIQSVLSHSPKLVFHSQKVSTSNFSPKTKLVSRYSPIPYRLIICRIISETNGRHSNIQQPDMAISLWHVFSTFLFPFSCH